MLQDPQLIADFVAQSLEHLEDVEPSLLDMEKRGEADADSTNEVFRAIHSIKGAAGFLGLESIQALSHAMESLLMHLRDGDLEFRAEMADPLLSGVDLLRRMLRSLPESEGESDPALIARLERLRGEGGSDPGGDDDSGSLAAACRRHLERGHHLAVLPLPHRKRDRAGLVERVERYGEVIREHAPGRRQLLVASPLEVDLLAEALGLDPARVSKLDAATLPGGAPRDEAAAAPEAGVAGGLDPAEDAELEDFGVPISDRRAETVRVSVSLLDKLMNLAGELVLGRNQLRQLLEDASVPGVKGVLQNVDLVTTELQENIMRTRMQPVRVLFDRLPRLVRDLAQKLDKRVDIELVGGDVELDRSIIEALADPLTHVIRNAVDHGIEIPGGRRAAGKADTGRVTVRAYHERGRVVIDVRDDGRGIDPERLKRSAIDRGLIPADAAAGLSDRDALALAFYAGLSTSADITDVSGRGVGMDVVRTNIQNLGGQVDLESAVGEGTAIRIHLPLTLAIISSLIVSVAGERFAIPQVNLVEVVSLRDGAHPLESIRGIEVLRLRGSLLPLVRLASCLGIEASAPAGHANVVVLRAGSNQYGLVVDELHDSEEIVVKPLSSYLSDCGWYAGATILGDGCVATILDAGGIARRAALRFEEVALDDTRDRQDAHGPQAERRSLVLFENAAGEHFALPLSELLRLEHVQAGDVERVGSREFLQHRGRPIPLVRLESVLPVGHAADGDEFFVLIPRSDREAGIVASRVVDTLDCDVQPDATHIRARGLLGSAIIRDRLTLFLDTPALLEAAGVEETTP